MDILHIVLEIFIFFYIGIVEWTKKSMFFLFYYSFASEEESGSVPPSKNTVSRKLGLANCGKIVKLKWSNIYKIYVEC